MRWPVLFGVLWLQGCSHVDELTADQEKRESDEAAKKAAAVAAEKCEAAKSASAETSGESGCVIYPRDPGLSPNKPEDRTAIIEKDFKFRCVDCSGACKGDWRFQIQKLADEPNWKVDGLIDGAKVGAGSTWEHASLLPCEGGMDAAETDNDKQQRLCGGLVIALLKEDKREFCSEAMLQKALDDKDSGLFFLREDLGGEEKSYKVVLEEMHQYHLSAAEAKKEHSDSVPTVETEVGGKQNLLELLSDSPTGSRSEELRPATPLVATHPAEVAKHPAEEWVVHAGGSAKRRDSQTLVEE